MATDLMDAPPAAITPAQQREIEHYEAIKEKAAEVRAAREAWASARDKAKSKKGVFDELNAELIQMIDDGPPLQGTLFPKKGNAEPAKPAPNDAWRAVKVDQLDIKPTLVTKLAEHGLENLGQLSDFWKARKDLTELKGIGEASASKIIDAFSDYGTKHPEIYSDQDGEQPTAAELDEASSPEAQLGTALAEEDRDDGEEGKPELGVVGDDDDDEEDEELMDDWPDDDGEDVDELDGDDL